MDNNVRPMFDKPAFVELAASNGVLMVWVNRTLLPDISATMERSSNPELIDFSRACREIYRHERDEYSNSSCKITAEEREGTNGGAKITFQPNIGSDAIRSFINTPNRAIAKIGFEWRNLGGWEEIRWRGRRDFFICGVNVPAQAATLTFNRSALLELVRILPEHPFQETFTKLVSILDIENEDVDEELDNDTAAIDESLMETQQ